MTVLLALLLSVFPPVNDYHFLTGPDSTIPLPETRLTDRLPPAVMPGGEYRDGSYYVKRWYDSNGRDNWVLIGLATSFEPRLNLHVRPVGFAYWRSDRGWIARCSPYTGFNAKDELLDECDRGNTVPCGVFGPTWRLDPPTINITTWATYTHGNPSDTRNGMDSVQVEYIGARRVTRTFTLGDTLKVEDK